MGGRKLPQAILAVCLQPTHHSRFCVDNWIAVYVTFESSGPVIDNPTGEGGVESNIEIMLLMLLIVIVLMIDAADDVKLFMQIQGCLASRSRANLAFCIGESILVFGVI